MAKKACRRAGYCEKNTSGCKWTLTKILEFGEVHCSSRKLLSDQSHTSDVENSRSKFQLLCEDSPHLEEVQESEKSKVVDGNRCIKKLMEDEMICTKNNVKSPNRINFLYEEGKDSFEQVPANRAVYQSKKFKERLKMFNSDKELFLELLKAPNLSSDVEIDNSKRPEVSSKGSDLVSRRMLRYKSSTGVGLGSSPQPQYCLKGLVRRRRTRLKFSLREVKRKLKDALAHKTSNKHGWKCREEKGNERKVRSKQIFKDERIEIPSTGVDSNRNLKEKSLDSLKQRESRIYARAKKQLAERFSTKDEANLLVHDPGRLRSTLGSLLSLPDYNFPPIQSPGKDKDNSFVNADVVFPSNDDLRVSREAGDNNEDLTSSVPIISEESSFLEADTVECICSTNKELSPEGSVQIVEPTEGTGCFMDDEFFEIPSVPFLTTPITNSNLSADTDKTNAYINQYFPITLESPMVKEMKSSLESLSDSCSPDEEKVVDELEQSSPASVLDPLCLDDDVLSHARLTLPNEQQIQPVALNFEEHHIYTPKEAHLTSSEEDQIFSFDSSFISEVELMLKKDHSCYDKNLPSDCINEVIVEVYDRYFGCSPWISFVNPSTQGLPTKIVYDIRNGLNRYLSPHSHRLDKIVEKDMAQCRTWMDLRLDIEYVNYELVDIILEDLLKETVFKLLTSSTE